MFDQKAKRICVAACVKKSCAVCVLVGFYTHDHMGVDDTREFYAQLESEDRVEDIRIKQ